jgi:hypothetical protein
MGFDEQDSDADDVVVITEETVLREARNRGFTVREAEDGISWEISSAETMGFFPKAFVAGGYTEAQLDMVQAAFHECGIELFPLERSLH